MCDLRTSHNDISTGMLGHPGWREKQVKKNWYTCRYLTAVSRISENST